MQTIDSADRGRTHRLNVTVKPETKARLDDARNKRRIEINVSHVCDRAINAELDRLDQGAIADTVSRLRVESDRRRGAPYRRGHLEGQTWATNKGSWAEISFYGSLDESAVIVENVRLVSKGGTRAWDVPTFKGDLTAPEPDYGRSTWKNLDAAPAYPTDDTDWNGNVTWEHNLVKLDQYWRGWLAGVQDVFDAVRQHLPAIAPQKPATQAIDVEPDEVDPDDIPF